MLLILNFHLKWVLRISLYYNANHVDIKLDKIRKYGLCKENADPGRFMHPPDPLNLLFSRRMYSFVQHVVHVLFIIYTAKNEGFSTWRSSKFHIIILEYICQFE